MVRLFILTVIVIVMMLVFIVTESYGWGFFLSIIYIAVNSIFLAIDHNKKVKAKSKLTYRDRRKRFQDKVDEFKLNN